MHVTFTGPSIANIFSEYNQQVATFLSSIPARLTAAVSIGLTNA